MQNKKSKKILYIALSGVFWILVWWGVALYVNQELLVSSPKQVALRLYELMGEGSFWMSVLYSLVRVSLGYILAVVVAVVLSTITHASQVVYHLSSPLMSIVKAVPVASFIILALIWLNKDIIPVFITFLIVLPIVWGNLHRGLKETDPKLLEMCGVYNVPLRRQVCGIYIPSVKPYFTSACKTAVGLAWKSGVAAEVLCKSEFSIGGHMYDAKIYLETTDVFAWTAVTVVLSVIIEAIITAKSEK
ncbi:MAG: ABC transporter permease subunit [Clostridia bacterium]|nr:ABC transporter permease subunit [Clostridia bacterium]